MLRGCSFSSKRFITTCGCSACLPHSTANGLRRSAEERAAFGLREALGRPAEHSDVRLLVELVRLEEASGRSDADAHRLATGMTPSVDGSGDHQELAAWTVAAGVLLNLDAVLTKE